MSLYLRILGVRRTSTETREVSLIHFSFGMLAWKKLNKPSIFLKVQGYDVDLSFTCHGGTAGFVLHIDASSLSISTGNKLTADNP